MKPQHVTNGPQPFLKMTNQLRDLRLNRKVTQVDIAEGLSMPRGSYSLLESGVTLPTEAMLKNLIRTFKCKETELYSDVYLDIIKVESFTDE